MTILRFLVCLAVMREARAAFVAVGKHSGTRPTSLSSGGSGETTADLGLTPELQKITDAFKMIDDEQIKYKQLLYMASNTAKANNMPETSKIPENKVPGCLSTVYVDGKAMFDEEKQDYVIDLIGDSDGLLTRGLVALLVRGASGNTAEDIQKINPEFIKVAGISQSLTPGRNNGFLNMLNVIKKKAMTLDAEARETSNSAGAVSPSTDEEKGSDVESNDHANLGPKGQAILQILQVLKPTSLKLIDNSAQHAGHAGNDMDGESHFELEIVAGAFDGLSLVKRHKLVYMFLNEIMPQIHALQIKALTPEEASKL